LSLRALLRRDQQLTRRSAWQRDNAILGCRRDPTPGPFRRHFEANQIQGTAGDLEFHVGFCGPFSLVVGNAAGRSGRRADSDSR
jgi:hypothetical protein